MRSQIKEGGGARIAVTRPGWAVRITRPSVPLAALAARLSPDNIEVPEGAAGASEQP
ncbi:MAG: hypothetical protein AAFN16_15225 [Pseudomonadota bacterium]